MNITSNNTIIFVREFEGKTHYRAGLSSKKQDGTYENGYIDVRLPKGVELADKTKINITKGFLSFYNYTDKEGKNKTIWYIVVQEYTVNGEVKKEEKEDVYAQFGTSIKAEDLDNGMELPF